MLSKKKKMRNKEVKKKRLRKEKKNGVDSRVQSEGRRTLWTPIVPGVHKSCPRSVMSHQGLHCDPYWLNTARITPVRAAHPQPRFLPPTLSHTPRRSPFPRFLTPISPTLRRPPLPRFPTPISPLLLTAHLSIAQRRPYLVPLLCFPLPTSLTLHCPPLPCSMLPALFLAPDDAADYVFLSRRPLVIASNGYPCVRLRAHSDKEREREQKGT